MKLAFFCALSASGGHAFAASQTFSGGTNGNGTGWLTAGNWVGGAVPGSTSTGSTSTNTDVATVGSTGSNPDLGINLNVTGGTYGLGAINFNSATRNVGDSSTAANAANGTVRLNGATVNGVSNVVLRNFGSGTLALQGAAFNSTITGVMSIALGNATNNVVEIDSSGGITANAVIKDGATGAKLTLSGAGTGSLTLSQANTYSGGTLISQGNLVATNATSATGSGAVTVGNNVGNAVLSGTGTITGAVTTATTGSNIAFIAPGVNTGANNFGNVGTLSLKGGLSVGAGSNFNFDLASTNTAASDQIALGNTALTLGGTVTFNFNLLTVGTLATGANYTLISGASNATLDLTGVSFTSTGLGIYTASYSYSGGSLLVNFSTNSTPNYFGVTGTGYDANSTVFDATTQDFNSASDGSGTVKAFDPAQTAIFGGTSGTVTVGTVTANAGVRFASGGYVFNGGTLTLGTVGNVEVTNAADTATINTTLAGTVGLTKLGLGTLVLGGSNGFSGNVSINAGTLSVSADASLGATGNAIVLGGGTLQTTASITSARGLSGSGTIDTGASNTLALSGTVATTALTLTNTGTISLSGAGNSVGSVTFNAAGTIANTNAGALAVGNITTATTATGTATISGPVSLASGTHTFTVVDGNTSGTDLALTGGISGTGAISMSGGGTLALNGTSAYTGTITLGSSTTNGGTISVLNAASLGTTGTINYNVGAISNDTGALVTFAKTLSIGATTATTGAVFAGGATEYSGGISFYSPTAAAQLIVVNNTTTTFSGVVVTGSAASNGVSISGSGTLLLSGSAVNTFVQPVTVGGTATLNLAKAGALGSNTGLAVGNGATVLLSGVNTTTDRINNAAAVTLNGGSTLNTGSLSEGTRPSNLMGSEGTAGVGALTLANTTSTAAVTLNFGSATAGSSLVFASLATASKGAYVTILNWGGLAGSDDGGGTYDRLLFTTDPGLTLTDLANFNFSGFAPGGIEIAYGNTFEIVPVPEASTVLGGVLLVCAAGWSQRRRLRTALAA